MILILSEQEDGSTNHVIDWMLYKDIAYQRVNREDKLLLEKFAINNDSVCIEIRIPENNASKVISYKSLNGFWYRRGYMNIAYFTSDLKEEKSVLHNYLYLEWKALVDTIHYLLIKLPHIGNPFHNQTNKLHNLFLAKKLGLKVPNTLVTSTLEELRVFYQKKENIITKAIDRASFPYGKKEKLRGLTSTLSDSDLSAKSFFFPSKFQEKIDKAYELRIFYINKQFYVSAIFSQLDNQTETDFRNYNNDKPNRTPPYKLPIYIEQKLCAFMQKLNMKSGSIDMIVTKQKEYFFLEVNPVGQFRQVSRPCNFFLEEKFVNFFKNERNKI